MIDESQTDTPNTWEMNGETKIDVEECPEIPDELGENKSNLGSQNDSLNGQIIDEETPKIGQNYLQISRMLRSLEVLTSAGVSILKLRPAIFNIMNIGAIRSLGKHLFYSHSNHSLIILKIFENLLRIGASIELFDEVFTDLRYSPAFQQVFQPQHNFSGSSSFVNAMLGAVINIKSMTSKDIKMWFGQLEFSIIGFLKTMMRIKSETDNSCISKLQSCLNDKLADFLKNRSGYSPAESNLMMSLFEGGQFLEYRSGAYATTKDNENVTIAGFTNDEFIKRDNSYNREVYTSLERENYTKTICCNNKNETTLQSVCQLQLEERQDQDFSDFLLQDSRLSSLVETIIGQDFNKKDFVSQYQLLKVVTEHLKYKGQE